MLTCSLVLDFLSLHLAAVWKAGTTVSILEDNQRLGGEDLSKSAKEKGRELQLEPTS